MTIKPTTERRTKFPKMVVLLVRARTPAMPSVGLFAHKPTDIDKAPALIQIRAGIALPLPACSDPRSRRAVPTPFVPSSAFLGLSVIYITV